MAGIFDVATIMANNNKRTKEDSKAAVREVFAAIKEYILKNPEEHVSIRNFGTFKTSVMKAHNSRNPATGKAVKVPARRRLKFQSTADFKEKLKHLA